VLFAALWLTATTWLVKPNEDAFRRGRVPSLGRRRAEGRDRETVQSAG
jgi:hypothetical protein